MRLVHEHIQTRIGRTIGERQLEVDCTASRRSIDHLGEPYCTWSSV